MTEFTNADQKIEEISESTLAPKQAHLAALGDYDDEVLHSQVVVMTYIRSKRRKSGIIIPGKSQTEDRFQGKIGLVVAMGPGAFKDDAVAKFHGKKLKVGDWVMTRPADGMEFFYNGCPLRLFQDVDIKVRLKTSDLTKYW